MSKKPKSNRSSKARQEHEDQAPVVTPAPLVGSPWFPDPRRLLAALDAFFVDVNAFTIPSERGRAVPTMEAAVALSESQDKLQSEVLRAKGILTGPRTILVKSNHDLGTLPRRAGPEYVRMQAALKSLMFILAIPVERSHQDESNLATNRYQSGDIIPSEMLSQGEVARRILETFVPEPQRPEWEKLLDAHWDCLEALMNLHALSESTRRKARAIAQEAGMEPDSAKEPLADLVRMGLADSKKGRSGGSWLLPRGLAVMTERKRAKT